MILTNGGNNKKKNCNYYIFSNTIKMQRHLFLLLFKVSNFDQ